MIQAGLQRLRIRIFQRAPRDDFGSGSSDVLLYEMKARKIHKKGDEKIATSGQIGIETFDLKIRYRPNITQDCYITSGNDVFDIIAINNINEKNRELLVTCQNVSRRETVGL